MLVLGVDEAGYGPLLGPLVVASAGFRAPVARGAEPDLRAMLTDAIAAPAERRKAGRLVVGDSKEVYGGTHEPARLELPVLAFLAAASSDDDPRAPADLDALLRAVGVGPAVRRSAPWYGGEDPPPTLPRWTDADSVHDGAVRLRRSFARSGVSFAGFAARVLTEGPLNERFVATGNKAEVLFSTSADVLSALLERSASDPGDADDDPRVLAILDRQGGRRAYLAPLSARWPSAFAWALSESATSSRYQMTLCARPCELRFEVKADRDQPQVSLASLCAKYLREIFMDLWNGHFARLFPDVPPTAGYTQDGRRWLDATRARRTELGISDARLVRVR